VITTENLRKVALVETISWTILIITIVIDRTSGWHGGISIMGPIHGVLSMALFALALGLTLTLKWPWSQFVKIILASLVPIWGYFWIHGQLEDVQLAAAAQPSAR